MSVDDRYTYPQSGGVLVNKYGIRDAARLDEAMNDAASVRWAELQSDPAPSRFNIAQLRETHRRLFQDVLPFAGELRTVNVQAAGTGIAYCRPEFLQDEAARIDAGLRRENYLQGLGREAFAERLAYYWGEITALHPMRDGNTRSQSAFVSQLAEAAGHPLDWTKLDVDRLRELRLVAMSRDHRPLASYLEGAVVDRPELDQTMWLVSLDFPAPAAEATRRPSQTKPPRRRPIKGFDRGLER